MLLTKIFVVSDVAIRMLGAWVLRTQMTHAQTVFPEFFVAFLYDSFEDVASEESSKIEILLASKRPDFP